MNDGDDGYDTPGLDEHRRRGGVLYPFHDSHRHSHPSHPIIRQHCIHGPDGSQTATNPLGALAHEPCRAVKMANESSEEIKHQTKDHKTFLKAPTLRPDTVSYLRDSSRGIHTGAGRVPVICLLAELRSKLSIVAGCYCRVDTLAWCCRATAEANTSGFIGRSEDRDRVSNKA